MLHWEMSKEFFVFVGISGPLRKILYFKKRTPPWELYLPLLDQNLLVMENERLRKHFYAS